MRVRKHLTYANVMATIAVFGVVAGGGAYAVSKIDTPDIANRAITAKKLDSGAVKTSKLHSGAVTSAKLAEGAVEIRNLGQSALPAMAGVQVLNGEVRGSFNRFGDIQPILEHTQPGVYHLYIPGAEAFSHLKLLSPATLFGTQPGEVTTRWTFNSAGDDFHSIVSTFDSNGNPVDRSFTLLIYLADHEVL